MQKLITNALIYFTILVLWQLVSFTFLPSPVEVLISFYHLLQTSSYWVDVGHSLFRFVAGVGLGIMLGSIVGVALAGFRKVNSVLMPILSFLYPIPKIALLPLFLIWFGFGEFPKVLLIFMGAFFPVAITTYSSYLRIPQDLIDASHVAGASRLYTIRRIVIPYIIPSIVSNSRIPISIGLTLLVAAEMVGADSGIGQFIMNTGSLLALDQMFVGIFTLSLIALLSNFAISYTEKNFFQWKNA